MRRLKGIIVPVLSSSWLAACATSAVEMAPDRADRPWTPATTASGEIIAGEKAPPERPAGTSYLLPQNKDLGTVPPPLAVDRNKAYSLAALIDIAESNNPLTRIAWNDARNVALLAGIAEATFLPKLTASAVGGYQVSNGQNSALGTSIGGGTNAKGTVSALSLEWLLFDFGERAAAVEAAKQASVISNIAFTAAHQQVIYAVTLGFYANAAARAHVDTATQSLKNAENVEAAAENRYKQGIGTTIEAAQARQATAQARLALVQAKGAAQNSYLSLISAMGISPLTQIKVADVSHRKLSLTMTGRIEDIISDSLARRPDVLAAYAAEKASLAKVNEAEAEFLPKLFLSSTGTYNTGSLALTGIPAIGQQGTSTLNLSNNQLGATILAGVTVPLYDGGTRLAILQQAQANADNANIKLIRTREEAVRQIVLADNALHTSLSAYSASTALAAAAQTTFDAALTAYRSGVGSITDATLAQSQLLVAKNTAIDAYNAALSAAATLALAAGALGAAPE
jgi:outer membrane protein TolC